jgi:phosphate-selective porin
MMDQLVPQRDEGFMIHGEKLLCDRFDYAVAVSNGDPNDSTLDTNNDKDVNARVVVRPFFDSGSDLLRGWRIGLSGSIGVENDTISTTSSTLPTITTPATVDWFAFNASGTTSSVVANGVRHRISPELVYFYRSFGFASQYYRQDQKLQSVVSGTAGPIVDLPIESYYVMATYLLTGEERTGYSQQIDPFRPFDPSAPLASPGAWELVFRVERMEVGQQAFTGPHPLASLSGSGNQSTNAATEVTSGLNWYMTKWARAQLNWEHANFASPVKLGNVSKAFSEEDTLYTRFQVIF